MNEAPTKNSGALKRVKIVTGILTAVMLSIITAVFSLLLKGCTPSNDVIRADDGFKKAKATIDPEKLRVWALDAIKRWPSTNDFPTVPDTEIPAYIKSLYSFPPEFATVGRNTVTITWGGGFFHWGITIGNTNYFEPFKTGNGEYSFEWTNGIYYRRESDWKLQ